jgi:hypothetical protein
MASSYLTDKSSETPKGFIMPSKKSKKPLDKETNLPNGGISSEYYLSEDHFASMRRWITAESRERVEKRIEYLKRLEKREVPVWYDVMHFCEKRPETAPQSDRYSDWSYYYGSRPKFYLESIDPISPYHGKWFRILSPDIRKILCGVNGAEVKNGKLSGYWTFTRSGSAVGVRYLGKNEEAL